MRSAVERENLFSLSIGRMEDELDMFALSGQRSTRRTSVKMRDGIFYIANGNGAKLARYNSYGDLLSLIYNAARNPVPRSLSPATDGVERTRWAAPWPFREPGALAVSSALHIYVEDAIAPERHSFDTERGVIRDRAVLHFDADGRFIEYVGQEGRGGTPFPRIEGIFTSVNDELAVVCKLPAGRSVFWYGANGRRLYTAYFTDADLPSDEEGPSATLDGIAIAPDERLIYLKADYYRDITDEDTGTVPGLECAFSRLFAVSVPDGAIKAAEELPVHEAPTGRRGSPAVRLPYTMLGAASERRVYFYRPTDEGLELLVVSEEGGVKRGALSLSADELAFSAFDISPEGVLSAILATGTEARIVWWRTDRL
jgi:hypothetical protein